MSSAKLLRVLCLLAATTPLAACDGGPYPTDDGKWRIAATDRSQQANLAFLTEQLKQEADAFCRARGETYAMESSAGSSRPLPVQASLFFRCDPPALPHEIEPPPAVDDSLPAQIAVVSDAPAAPATAVPTTAAPNADPPPRSPGEDAPLVGGHRVVVSFNSLAAGTDPATEARFLALVAAFEAEVGHPLPWSRGHWGREGEYDACLNLLYASQAQQADFARRLREALEPGGRASVREYSHCGHFPTR